MESNNKENITNQNDSQNRIVSPEVVLLGELKKDSTGKAGFIVIIFLIIAAGFLSWPYIEQKLIDSEGWLGQLYDHYLGKPEDRVTVDNDTMHLLDANTNILFDNIRITDVKIEARSITYNIYMIYQKDEEGNEIIEPINLDNRTLYLEIYGSSGNNLIRRIKLTGIIGPNKDERTFNFTDINFNPDINFYGRMKSLEETDYPDIIMTSDYMLCTNEIYKYTYRFNNAELMSLIQEFNYTTDGNLQEYMGQWRRYQSFSNIINGLRNSNSEATETETGFSFIARIDLEYFSQEQLGESTDYNYHEYRRSAKRINYEMAAKGFRCEIIEVQGENKEDELDVNATDN